MVITYAVQSELIVTPNRLKAHAYTRSVKVRLESHNLSVLLQYNIVMHFLVGFVWNDINVHTVASSGATFSIFRLIAMGEKVDTKLQMAYCFTTIGVQVRRIKVQC